MRPQKSTSSFFLSAAFVLLAATAAFCGGFDGSTESIGSLKLGLPEAAVSQSLPGTKPPRRGPVRVFGADGLYHQTWTFPGAGIELDMVSASKGGAKSVGSITVSPPCRLATGHGIRIGSTSADALKAYKSAFNKAESKAGETLVFGSVFGGLIVSVKDGKVSGLFLGAGAE